MEAKIVLNVRAVTPLISIVDIQGEITSSAEVALADAYIRAGNAKYIVLNFSGLEYMNSSGIGLLVTLLIRAKRQGQKLLAFGLTDHYREIFELTRLNEVIALYAAEADALASVEVAT